MDAHVYDHLHFRISGDCALLVDCGDGIDLLVNQKVVGLAARIKKNMPPGITAVVPAYRSLALLYNPLLTNPDLLKEHITALDREPAEQVPHETERVSIPVCYGGEFGPDIDFVASHTGLDINEIINLHTSRDYPVYMLGFTPGFCYLGGMDERLRTPRRKTPRIAISPGSVGIAEMQTGMYPVESPGGWQIIGKTPLRLFAPERENPFLYKAGDRIRFYPVTPEAFNRIQEKERP